MNEHQALRVSGTDPAPVAPFNMGETPGAAAPQKEYRSGVFAKSRREAGGGWGLVLIDLVEPPRPLVLSDGAVIGSASRDARVEGTGIAPEHVRVNVRSDGCYVEDLGSSEGTYVGGVRARRINVMHGDVVRLGRQLAVFVERDLAAYTGPVERSGGLVHGPKQRRDWIGPVLDLVRAGSCVCIEGGPGVGKRTLARLAASLRESTGEVVVVDGAAEAARASGADGERAPAAPLVPPGARPATWLVLNADRVPRPVQLEIAHAVGRGGGASIIATVNQPLDRAAGDGNVAPWFATLFSGKRITVPSLDARREDILPIVRDICERRAIPLERLGAEVLEALVRSGWPGGVPQLEAALVAAAETAPEGPISLTAIVGALARPRRIKPSLPPSTDPGLARARLEDALARANGSVASAARALGMSRQAIYREADRLGLDIARRKARS
jgi:FHA domain/Bacterial regulatory protein, Fis family